MRELVGPTDPAAFANPTGDLVFPDVEADRYKTVLDFGCGCGRLARQLAEQRHPPQRYVGLDLHLGMVAWCQENLAPRLPGFEFHHCDVFQRGFNPSPDAPDWVPFPLGDGEATLVVAWSVFTHLLEEQVVPYLQEVRRVLAPDGVFASTWFLFEKALFPMMQSFQNALYINTVDPTNAVIFDRTWLVGTLADCGLVIRKANRPEVRGFQWELFIGHARAGEQSVELPADEAALGRVPPPVGPENAHQVGLRAL